MCFYILCVSLSLSLCLSLSRTNYCNKTFSLSICLGPPSLSLSLSFFCALSLSLPLTMHSLMGLTVHCLSNGSLCLSSSLSLPLSLSLFLNGSLPLSASTSQYLSVTVCVCLSIYKCFLSFIAAWYKKHYHSIGSVVRTTLISLGHFCYISVLLNLKFCCLRSMYTILITDSKLSHEDRECNRGCKISVFPGYLFCIITRIFTHKK
mgnify:CR=1 FL=1